MSKSYAKNFLTNVIFRIDFSPILKIDTELPIELQEKVRMEFPEYNNKIENLIQTTKLPDGEIKLERPGIHNIHRIYNPKKNKTILIQYNFVSLENQKYINFHDFKNDVKNLYDVFSVIYRPLNIKRIGLRYINEIIIRTGNPLEWNNYINTKLISPIDFFNDKDTLSRIMTTSTINKEDLSINYICGIYNPEYPAKISRKEFIIDIDCYSHDYDENRVIEFLDKARKEAKLLFEKSIKKDLRSLMEVNNESQIS
ncbi:TIGR04255 family protein [bacterium]|nr:TIGR04255 family protein [bacterium]